MMIVLRLHVYCDVSQTNIMHIVVFFITVIYNTTKVQFNDDTMSVTTVKCNKCMIRLEINLKFFKANVYLDFIEAKLLINFECYSYLKLELKLELKTS